MSLFLLLLLYILLYSIILYYIVIISCKYLFKTKNKKQKFAPRDKKLNILCIYFVFIKQKTIYSNQCGLFFYFVYCIVLFS